MAAPTYVSLFAGAGGFDLGFDAAGFRCVAQVEIDPTARDVLARHWPDVPRYEDVRAFGKAQVPHADVVVGGFPCQDVSVAGKGAGLAGKRSGLFYEMVRVVDELRPAYLLWENVPGLRSNGRGRDFLAVLAELDRLGFGGGWASFDARHFGVPQSRERVFGLFARGGLGAAHAAEVFALRKGVRRDTAAGREAGAGVAAAVGGGAAGAGGASAAAFGGGSPAERSDAAALLSRSGCRGDFDTETFVVFNCKQAAEGASAEVAPTLRAMPHDLSHANGGGQLAVALNWQSGGDVRLGLSETHVSALGCEQTPAVLTAIPIDMRQASRGETMTNNRPGGSSGGAPGTGIGTDGDPAPTLGLSHTPAVCVASITPDAYDREGEAASGLAADRPGLGIRTDGITQTLRAKRPNAVCVGCLAPDATPKGNNGDLAYALTSRQERGHGNGMAVCVTGTVTHTLTANGADASEDGTGRGTPIVALPFAENQRNELRVCDAVPALQATGGGRPGHAYPAVIHGGVGGYLVRRLTPRECERLMGWPDDHTRWRADGREIKDGPRYRLCGNGVVATVSGWIARRLMAVIQKGE